MARSKSGRRSASGRTPLNRNEGAIPGRDRLLSAAPRRLRRPLHRPATQRASAVDLSNQPSQQSPRVRFRNWNNRIVVLNAAMRKFIHDDVFQAAGEKGACRETAPRLQVVPIGLKMQQIVKESDSMKSKFGKAIVSGLALAFANCVAVSANAATVFVGTCVSPSFSTIQAAVTAVPAGSTVNVCPGTYPEQVSINKRLTLQGIASGTLNQAVVTAPAGGIVANTVSLATAYPIAAQIYVHDTARGRDLESDGRWFRQQRSHHLRSAEPGRHLLSGCYRINTAMSSHEIRPRYLPMDARRGLGWAFSYRAASAS